MDPSGLKNPNRPNEVSRFFKTICVVVALVSITIVVLGAASPSADAGSGNRERIMEAGQCGQGFQQTNFGPFLFDYSLTTDSSGRVFVANRSSHVCVIGESGTVEHFAGLINSNEPYSPEGIGDGGPATEAPLQAIDLTVDSDGNVFIADIQRVRKVDSQGIIATVAGNGESGGEGIDGPATEAQLWTVPGLATAPNGDLYLLQEDRILKVDTNGILRRFAGRCFGLGGDGGPAIDAEFAYPNDIAVSSTGIVYVSDGANKRIRKIDQSGIITTLYGDGNLGPPGCKGMERPDGGTEPLDPDGVAVDSSGNVVVADGLNRILVISPANDRCSIPVEKPVAVAVDSSDRIIYALQSGEVWRIDDFTAECEPDSSVITTWGETRSPTSYRRAAFRLGFSTDVTGLESDDFTISGSAPGCLATLDITPEEYFRVRAVLVSCQGPGTVKLTLKKGAVSTPNRGSGPPSALEGPEIELVNGAVLRVSRAVYNFGEQGTLTSNTSGINCGDTCHAIVTPGTRVTLTATPGFRNAFLGWSGACSGTGTCTVTVRGDIDVQAQFFPGVLLAATKIGTGGGTVTASSGGLSCGNRCSTYVEPDQPVVLTARASSGSVFAGWFGGGCYGTGTCSIRGGASVFAVFDRR
jgi:hypothetical protein